MFELKNQLTDAELDHVAGAERVCVATEGFCFDYMGKPGIEWMSPKDVYQAWANLGRFYAAQKP